MMDTLPCTANEVDMYAKMRMTSMKQGQKSNQSLDKDSASVRIIPVPSQNVVLRKPVLIAGFLDLAMQGTVAASYLVEQLKMHQIAFIESQYVIPAAIFIGKKFRHPFRIYSNDAGTVIVLICEGPVSSRGGSSIIEGVLEWADGSGIRQLLVLGSILPTSFSPSHMHQRKALLLQNGYETADSPEKFQDPLEHESKTMFVPDTAVIGGLAGALLSSCAAKGIKCSAVLIPTLSDAPDPEGVALLLESLGIILPDIKVDTSSLRQAAEMMKKELEELLKMHQHQMKAYEDTEHSVMGGMYK